MNTRAYPPPSFEVVQLSYKYHYGFQGVVALSITLTGLQPHFIMFSVLTPTLELLSGLLIYDICRRLTGTHVRAVLALTLVLFWSQQYVTNYLDPAILEFPTSYAGGSASGE